MNSDRKICVGMIAGAHGVKGLVRLRSFTDDPESIASYGALSDEDGVRSFKIKLNGRAKDYFVASMGLANKEEADDLRGVKLYVPRSALPKTGTREYYEADLVGLAAKDKAGKDFGTVLAVHNYGAGPFLEIGKTAKDSFMLPFKRNYVPEVDVEHGLVIDLPAGWIKSETSDGMTNIFLPAPVPSRKREGDANVSRKTQRRQRST